MRENRMYKGPSTRDQVEKYLVTRPGKHSISSVYEALRDVPGVASKSSVASALRDLCRDRLAQKELGIEVYWIKEGEYEVALAPQSPSQPQQNGQVTRKMQYRGSGSTAGSWSEWKDLPRTLHVHGILMLEFRVVDLAPVQPDFVF